MKRFCDFCLASICMILFLPLFIIIYVAIKIEDGGPAFFKQERIGLYGKTFIIYKFRSLKLDSNQEDYTLLKHERNNNMTQVGRFLRDHHLDELPQLWNVLIGDMAFVGPRPERKYYIDLIIKQDARYKKLYQLRPGVTSYATLHNGYTDTMEKMLTRLKLDLDYLEHQSLILDAKILTQTFLYIVFGKKF